MTRSQALAVLLLSLAGCGEKAMFDSAKWATGRGNASGENVRLGMTADLAAAMIVPGAKRDHVHATLGQPDHRTGSREIYDLGHGAYAPDYETLVIDYDAAGVVTTIVQRQS